MSKPQSSARARRASLRAALLVAAAGTFVLLPRALERAAREIPGLKVRAGAPFRENGEIPRDRGIAADGERQDGFPRHGEPPGGGRFWSTWKTTGGPGGELVIGPFPAPGVIGLDACGYPRVGGNRLYLEDTATSQKIDLSEDNIGGEWCALRVRLPAAWRGRPVALHAVAGAGGFFGWMAVGVPREVPSWASGWNSFARALAGFAGVGAVLFLLQTAACPLLAGRREIPEGLLPLASFALVALAGYGVFWVFFASAWAGKAVAWALLGAAAGRFVIAGGRPSPGGPAGRVPLHLMVALGGMYLGILLLFGSDRSLYDVAAHRFIDHLAVDNEIPQAFADRLVHGEDPRHLAYGFWSSSDRPPLQTACDLLVAYPVSVAGIPFGTAAQAAGIWMQLVWICGAWAWLRAMGISGGASSLVIAGVALSGFALLNSLYAWPKLLAAAFILGAFAAWLPLRARGGAAPRDFGVIGGLAALGFLAQEGASFSILAWLLISLGFMRRQRLAGWAALAAVCAGLVLPWIAYQRLYDPPGNLLLKWHLAGTTAFDGRDTWETLRSAYGAHDLATLLGYRAANLATMLKGPWRELLHPWPADIAAQRDAQYYGVFFALGPWNLGLIALGLLGFRAWRGRGNRESAARLGLALGWCLLTLAVWTAIMFAPGSAVIHQGSYACVLLLFLVFALSLWLMHPAAFALVAALAVAGFAQVWLLPNPSRVTPLHPDAAVLAVLSFGLVAAVVASAHDPAEGQGMAG